MFYLNCSFVASLFLCESYWKFDDFISLFRELMLALVIVSTKFLFFMTRISPVFIIFFLVISLDSFYSFSNIKLQTPSFLFQSVFLLLQYQHLKIYILCNSLALPWKFCCVEYSLLQSFTYFNMLIIIFFFESWFIQNYVLKF